MSIIYLGENATQNILLDGEEVSTPYFIDVKHYLHDTLFLSFSFLNANNKPVDLSGSIIHAGIYDKNNVLHYELIQGQDIILGSTLQGILNASIKDEINIRVDSTIIKQLSTSNIYLMPIQIENNGDERTYFIVKIKLIPFLGE